MHSQKRSMRIEGHRTSVALEPEFWAALERMARSRKTTMPKLVAMIEGLRAEDQSLASALRVSALAEARNHV